MSYLNSTLLNGDFFQGGGSTAKSVSPIGSVLVDGTLRASIYVGLNASCAARGDSGVYPQIKVGLHTNQVARATNSSFVLDTKIKNLYSLEDVSIGSDCTLSKKHYIRSTKSVFAVPRGVMKEFVTLKSSVTTRAFGVMRSSGHISLNAACRAASRSDGQMSNKQALRVAGCISSISTAILGRKLGVIATGNPSATSSAVLRDWANYVSSVDARATLMAVLTKTDPYDVIRGMTGATARSSANLVRQKKLMAVQELRAIGVANMEERDTRPAPEDRVMIVPEEDRKMKVY